MVRSWRCKETEALFRTGESRRFRHIALVAVRKLEMIDLADSLADLSAFRGNRLEALKGDRKGQYSIRINDQYRICFKWNGGAHDVEITDYH